MPSKDELITHNGETRAALEWAIHLNMKWETLYQRLRKWPVEKALGQAVNCPIAHKKKSAKGAKNSPWRGVREVTE